jgi:hypothetical protein
MPRLLIAVLILVPALAQADQYPYVTKGPAIVGLTQSEAWITWYTAQQQGTSSFGNLCYLDALTGTPNDTIPAVTLLHSGSGGATFEDPTCDRQHRVHLVNLKPGTGYTFTLDKEYVSGGPLASGQFTTPPATADGTVRFVVYGDTRDEPTTSTSTRPDHQAVVDALVAHEAGAAFFIHTGDLALNEPVASGDDRGYTEFFDVERALLSQKPVYVAYGNHESIDSTFYDGLLNAGAISGAAHPYYFSFDWGMVHVVVLDSFEGPVDLAELGAHDPQVTDAQAQWLDGDLSAAHARGAKIFLLTHQGAYSHSNDSNAHGGLADVQQKVVPLMIKYGALGIFAGHDHYYQRGREGCVDYAVVGGGGAPMYDPDSTAAGVAISKKAPSYLAVTVTASGAVGDAYDTQGQVFDHFDFATAGCNVPDAGQPIVPPDASVALADAALVAPALDAASVPVSIDAGMVIAGLDASAAVIVADAASIASGQDAESAASQPDASTGTAAQPGCGCALGGSALATSFALLALMALRRRSGRG